MRMQFVKVFVSFNTTFQLLDYVVSLEIQLGRYEWVGRAQSLAKIGVINARVLFAPWGCLRPNCICGAQQNN